jgi:hypothetical protein
MSTTRECTRDLVTNVGESVSIVLKSLTAGIAAASVASGTSWAVIAHDPLMRKMLTGSSWACCIEL